MLEPEDKNIYLGYANKQEKINNQHWKLTVLLFQLIGLFGASSEYIKRLRNSLKSRQCVCID